MARGCNVNQISSLFEVIISTVMSFRQTFVGEQLD